MSNLFKPIRVGAVTLQHRVAMAPLARYRCDDDWVPLPMAKEYYTQRAAVPGTLLITEATFVSKSSVSQANSPGIYSEAQIARWKEITDAVHEKGSFIYCQVWHVGRAGRPRIHEALGTKLKSSSAVPMEDEEEDDDDAVGVPEAMTEADIQEIIADFATAARNAVAAGFDGVELHGANGYLIDQFTQDTCNRRTDSWGGSVEKRARFAVAAARAAADAIGPDRVAIRLSPFSDFQSMGMEDPYPQFEYLVRQLKPLRLAYLHLVEPRIWGDTDAEEGSGGKGRGRGRGKGTDGSSDFLIRLWANQSPVILAGGFKTESAMRTVDETWQDYDVLIAFGRYFVSNPDLVFRVREGIAFTPYDRSTFYTPKAAKGYIDYPVSDQYWAANGR